MEEDTDYKQIFCYSLAYQLKDKKLKRYSAISKNAQEVMTEVLSETTWSIDYISPSINAIYRKFDNISKSVLDFILTDIYETFNVIPIFNTTNKTISLMTIEEMQENKGLTFSYDQYLKSLNLEENPEEFCTCLNLYGQQGLSVEDVNPMGEKYIFDFSKFLYPFNYDYFLNQVVSSSYYMSDSLAKAILDYKIALKTKDGDSQIAEDGTTATNIRLINHGLVNGDYILNKSRNNEHRKVTVVDANNITVIAIADQQSGDTIYKYKDGTFRKLLFQKYELEEILTQQENELYALNEEKIVILDNIAVAEETGSPTAELIAQRDAKLADIIAKESEISTTETNITNKETEITDLRNEVSLSSNFTTEQLNELDDYMIYEDFVNESIIDPIDLYEAGLIELNKRKELKTVINIDIVNFLASIQNQYDWNKLSLGDLVTINYEKLGINHNAEINEIEINFEESSINLQITNVRKILTDKDKVLRDIYDAIHTTNNLNESKIDWNSVATNFNTRNDRISVTPANPVIANDGTAIDHTLNPDGSCNISFEWQYNVSGDAYNIDGFIIYVRSTSSTESYIFGSTIAKEQLYNVSYDRTGFILYGVPVNQYYTFGVQAYRKVDADISSNGFLKSDIIQSQFIGTAPNYADKENPYHPANTPAFSGNILDSFIEGVSSSSIADQTIPTVGIINNPIANSDGTVTITWNEFSDNQSGIGGYNVWRANDSTGLNKIIVGTVSSENIGTYTDNTTIHNITYYYWVTCFDRRGNETILPVSGWKQVTALNTTYPSAPTSISAVARLGRIDIIWINSTSNDVVAYRLEKSTNGGSDYLALAIVNTNNYTEYNISSPTVTIANWKYRVRAIDIIGLESETWTISSAPDTSIYLPADDIPPNNPNQPTGSSNYDGSITIQWTHTNPSDDLTKYRIYRSEDNITYFSIAEVIKENLQYTDTGLKNGQIYYYKISAIDNSGMESSLSTASVGLVATDSLAPIPPNPTAITDFGAIRLTWTEVLEKGVTYEIWRCSGGTWSDLIATKIATVAGSTSGGGGQGSYVDYDPPIQTETTYTYKLKAIDAWGNVSDFSTNSSTATSLIDFTGTIGGTPYDEVNKSSVTVIIADGLTSSEQSKKQANYVIPTSAPEWYTAQNLINSVINSLPSSGGKIVLLDGTYTVSGSINLKSNIIIQGQGASTVIKIADNINTDCRIIYGAIDINNITIKDMALDGNKNNNSSGIQQGIYLNGQFTNYFIKGQIQNINISNFRDSGIYFSWCKEISVISITSNNNANGLWDQNGFSNSIISSTFKDNSGTGIYLYQCSKNTVNSNNINDNVTSGIVLHYSSQGNTISNNTLKQNGHGIFLSSSNDNTIDGNIIELNKQHGIYVYNLNYDTDKVENNNIINNIIKGNGINTNNPFYYDGIYVSGYCNKNNIQNNIIRNSLIHNGIAQSGSSNTITLASNASIVDGYYVDKRIYLVSGTGSGETKIITAYNGISKVATVNSNWVATIDTTTQYEIKGTHRYGINIRANASNNVVTNNDLLQSGVIGSLSDSGSGTITTAGNRT